MKIIEESSPSTAQQIFKEIDLSKHSIDSVSEIIAEKMFEQKSIDDAERLNKVLMGNGGTINHNNEAIYKQGYHDAIEKACEYLDIYFMEIGYPDDWFRDSPNIEGGRKRFIKMMEE